MVQKVGTRIEVLPKESIDRDETGIVTSSPIKVYNIIADLTPEEQAIATGILGDKILDYVAINRPILNKLPNNTTVLEVSRKPGVNDPEGITVQKTLEDALGKDIVGVATSTQHLWVGELSEADKAALQRSQGSTTIEEFNFKSAEEWDPKEGMGFRFPKVELGEVPAFEYSAHPETGELFLDMGSKQRLDASDKLMWALSAPEMGSVENLFITDEKFIKDRLERSGLLAMPTDTEMGIFGQTWSEHCKHKKLGAIWTFTSDDPIYTAAIPRITDNLFKSVIAKTTYDLIRDRKDVISVFADNGGAFLLNENYLIAHKVETHNFPSMLHGFGGADTGVGGILRDAACIGKFMRIVSTQYGFRVPHPSAFPNLPPDVQSPLQCLEGIIGGVENYGNKFGSPTGCGNILYDEGWFKPGVIVGAVSVAPREINGRPTHTKDIRPGYIGITLGGKVGLDGIGGATGSSKEHSAEDESREDVGQAVQIGDPLTEKGVFEVMEILFNLDLIEASQDCGAGGWNSAVGEMTWWLQELEEGRQKILQAYDEKQIHRKGTEEYRTTTADTVLSEMISNKTANPVYDQLMYEVRTGEIFDMKTNGKAGCILDLTHAPTKYAGLAGWQKTISESQERNVLIIKPENLERVREICEHYNVDMHKIADFNDSGYYEVLDQDEHIAFLPLDFIHQGLPQWEIEAHWTPPDVSEPELIEPDDLTETFLSLIGRPNTQLHDFISERYDHEVGGRSFLKPLAGIGSAKSDAIAYKAVDSESEVAFETIGSNPWQGDIDPYVMGQNALVDAMGRYTAAGGNRDKVFNNGNTLTPKPESDPQIAAKVQMMIYGAADAEKVLNCPRISGKDSTSMQRRKKNPATGEEETIKSKPELAISLLGVMPHEHTVTSCDFKLPGDLIYIIGDTRDELGASEYYNMHDETGANVPKSDLEEIAHRYDTISETTRLSLAHSAQYAEKGGLAKAIANSAIGGDLGADIYLDNIDEDLGRADKLLFSETTGRVVVTVHPSRKTEFEKLMQERGTYCKDVGAVRLDKQFNVHYNGEKKISTDVDTMREANKGEIRQEKGRIVIAQR